MITAIAVDDEPLALIVIKTYCEQTAGIKLVGAFSEATAALEFLKKNPVDLLLLDINMPAISGIEFYKRVSKNTMVIFTTAFSQYAVEGFNLSAIDFLLKPFDFARFQKAIEKAKEYHEYQHHKTPETAQHLFVKVDYSLVKVQLSDILYIEGLDNYIKIHYDQGKTLLVRMTMKAITEKLPAAEFVRVHRSFIVPLAKVTSIRNKIIYLDRQEIPIGTNYAEDVLALFKDKL